MQPMGASLFPKDQEARYKKQLNIVKDLNEYFKNYRKKLPENYLNTFSLIGKNDLDRKKFANIFETIHKEDFNPQKLQLSPKESRGIAVMLGMAICDALGASTEFQPFKKQGHGLIKEGFEDIYEAIQKQRLSRRHGYIGVWTDDASMGLAMAYSLMLNDYNFDAINTRYMFHLWLEHGLGNGGRPHSIGLGGNISISMRQFSQKQTLPFTDEKNSDNNGNGSLMRLAPIPIVFCDDLQKARQAAQDQSRTTHNGLEAKECSRLMTEIIIALINRKQGEEWKNVLIQTCDSFQSKVKEVEYLAKGKIQTQEMIQQSQKHYPNFDKWNKGLKDRNWNWRDQSFTYSPTRTGQYSGYAGSYCMDGLAMALHMVLFTNSFKQCAVKCADMGGDCDSVGSIAGQIAGAGYGIGNDMLKLYSNMGDFVHGRYEVFLVGFKLINRKVIGLTKNEMQDEKCEENQDKQK